jgi:hypothetical protein
VRGQAGGIPSVGPTSIWIVLDRCLGLVITRHAAGHASVRRCPFHPHASTPPPPPTSFSLKHFPSDLPSLTAVAHPWPAPRRPTLALPLDMELQEGTAPPGGNGGPNANAPMPLIPCPFCGSQISTAVSRKGTRPGTRYYKCRFFSVSLRSRYI